MASTTAPSALSFLFGSLKGGKSTEEAQIRSSSSCSGRRRRCFRVLASETSSAQSGKAPPGVDTRIHWDNPDEGWIGGTTNSSQPTVEEEQQNLFGKKYSDLLQDSFDSHYQFLGVSTDSDLEEIKAAYRRLSKEYHPDTTSLPLKAASEKFMKLREVYDTLSNEERRKFYDWTLAQEAASRQAEKMKMKMKLDDPREQELRNFESIPDMVDRLGGRNMELSDQAMTGLTVDVFAVVFSICSIIVYVLFFQDPQ